MANVTSPCSTHPFLTSKSATSVPFSPFHLNILFSSYQFAFMIDIRVANMDVFCFLCCRSEELTWRLLFPTRSSSHCGTRSRFTRWPRPPSQKDGPRRRIITHLLHKSLMLSEIIVACTCGGGPARGCASSFYIRLLFFNKKNNGGACEIIRRIMLSRPVKAERSDLKWSDPNKSI